MLKGKEVFYILIAALVIGIGLGIRDLKKILFLVPIVLIVILINILAKKIGGYYLDSETETKIWELERFGFRAHDHFEKPVKIGAFLPLITAIISLGYFIWMAVLTTEIKSTIYRSARRFNLYKFSEITEWHMGLIVAFGIFANLGFAALGYLLGYSEFASISIYYAFFQIIPFSDLDGNKLFFGSPVLWAFTASIATIALGYVFFLV